MHICKTNDYLNQLFHSSKFYCAQQKQYFSYLKVVSHKQFSVCLIEKTQPIFIMFRYDTQA